MYSITAKSGGSLVAGKQDGKRKGGPQGSFIASVSLDIVREITDEGDKERRDNFAAVKGDITVN